MSAFRVNSSEIGLKLLLTLMNGALVFLSKICCLRADFNESRGFGVISVYEVSSNFDEIITNHLFAQHTEFRKQVIRRWLNFPSRLGANQILFHYLPDAETRSNLTAEESFGFNITPLIHVFLIKLIVCFIAVRQSRATDERL